MPIRKRKKMKQNNKQPVKLNRLRAKLSVLNCKIWKTVRHKFYSDDDKLYENVLKMRRQRKHLMARIEMSEQRDTA